MSCREICTGVMIALLAGCSSAESPIALPEGIAAAKPDASGAWEVSILSGFSSVPNAINARGQIAGSTQVSSGYSHAVVWEPDGTMTDLGTLGGNSSVATGINDRGVAVGASSTADGSTHAFVWDRKRGMVDITPGVFAAYPTDVNNQGSVAGYTRETRESAFIGFLWNERTGRTAIDGLGWYEGGLQPSGMNDRNEVVGSGVTADGETHAFYWSASSGTRDLGLVVDAVSSSARDINNSGLIAGSSLRDWVHPGPGMELPVSWLRRLDGTPEFLPTLGDNAGPRVLALNNSGAAAGYYWDTSLPSDYIHEIGAQKPAFWSQSGTIEALPLNPDADRGMATAMNDRGVLVGFEFRLAGAGGNRGVVWKHATRP